MGARNLIGMLAVSVCANETIAKLVAGAIAFMHHQGCGQSSPDLQQVERILVRAVAPGKTTKAESIGYFTAMDIWCHRPVI
ncbi:MAG TPA: hypothetical protein GXZ96_03630 [Firmicutes bacterium]|nr:hypothetical protein [Bacillota bacterium]